MPSYPTVPFITSSSSLASTIASSASSASSAAVATSVSSHARCSSRYISSIFQRFNIINRNARNVLSSSITRENEPFQIVLLKRTLSSKQQNPELSPTNNRPILEDVEGSIKLITSALNSKISSRGFPVDIRVLEYLKTPYSDQIKLLANTSMILGLESSSLLSAVNLPLGAPRCCAALELLPFMLNSFTNSTHSGTGINSLSTLSPATLKSSSSNNEAVLTQFGLHYHSLSIFSDSANYKLPIDVIISKIEEIIDVWIQSLLVFLRMWSKIHLVYEYFLSWCVWYI